MASGLPGFGLRPLGRNGTKLKAGRCVLPGLYRWQQLSRCELRSASSHGVTVIKSLEDRQTAFPKIELIKPRKQWPGVEEAVYRRMD